MGKKIGPYRLNGIYLGDSLKLLKKVPDACVDLVVTDPPFAIDFKGRRTNYNRTAKRVLEGYKEILPQDYPEFSKKWMSDAHRVLKDTGSMYVFSGWTNLKDILVALDDVGFFTVNHLIWKYQFGVFTKKKYVTSHYHILFVVKNKKKYKFNKIEHYPEDVWKINREYWSGKVKTATKLPRDVVRKPLLFSSDEGDVVLDPFMGSGTTAVVCKEEGRNYLGFEIVPEYVEFVKERLKGTK